MPYWKYFCWCRRYADDIALLAPTHSSMSKLLSICSSYSKKYNVQFNADKSKSLFFGCDVMPRDVSFSLGETHIQNVESYKHLGNLLGPRVAEENMRNFVRIFNGEVNLLLAQLNKCIPRLNIDFSRIIVCLYMVANCGIFLVKW